MRHPLEFVPDVYRKRFFFIFLLLTIVLFTVFVLLDQPLRTSDAPNGLVSFEFAFSPRSAFWMLYSWAHEEQLYFVMPYPAAFSASPPMMYAAFGLGLDYLFMPAYAFALAFGTLLTAGRHSGWLKSLGAVAGYGAFVVVLFDVVENFALFQVLLGRFDSS